MNEFMGLRIATPKTPLYESILPDYIEPGVKMIGEIFPIIAQKIKVLWGSSALQRYLYSIIIDHRGGRQGFPGQIVTVLLRIHSYHDKLVSDEHRNAWTQASY